MTLPMIILLTGVVAIIAALARSIPVRYLALGTVAWYTCVFFVVATIADTPAGASGLTWVPSLGVSFDLRIDGLGRLFALLISGIGAFVLLFATSYFGDDPGFRRFIPTLTLFLMAMLGVALADDVIVLFVFWEATSVASYLLIGYNHEDGDARAAALQALLVTGLGGIALLAGLLLLGEASGSLRISEILSRGPQVLEHDYALPALLLIFVGVCTKSAQVPFHFWLPSAMAAPTPVSAYLHSATMVKAGVFLLARLSPVFGEHPLWTPMLTGVGAVTLLTGAVMSLFQRDLKLILAYTTVSALGTMVLLLGAGGTMAVTAAITVFFAHALYKGALFLVAGAVDHGSGTRDIDQLGGLARAMPFTATAAGFAALSMAGVIPFIGFVAKELQYEAVILDTPSILLGAALFVGNACSVAAALLVSARVFLGRPREHAAAAHEGDLSLLAGPVTLSVLGLLAGAFTASSGAHLLSPAIVAVTGAEIPAMALWHGITTPFAAGVATLVAGALLYALLPRLSRLQVHLALLGRLSPSRAYQSLLSLFVVTAEALTRFLQRGSLRWYVSVLFVTLGVLTIPVFMRDGVLRMDISAADTMVHEWILAGLVIAAAVFATTTASRLTAVVALGVVGTGIAIVFLLHGAPDLAMTQFAVEVLTVVLFVLVLYRLPRFARLSRPTEHVRDVVLSAGIGAILCVLVLMVVAEPFSSRLTPFFAETSYELARGRNVVNVILVDYRAFDTLGEIVVLAIAAAGVFALLRLRVDEDGEPS